MRVTRRQAMRLYDWHGGQGTGVYALASNSDTGRCVPLDVGQRALKELVLAQWGLRLEHRRRGRYQERKQLSSLIAAVKRAVARAG